MLASRICCAVHNAVETADFWPKARRNSGRHHYSNVYIGLFAGGGIKRPTGRRKTPETRLEDDETPGTSPVVVLSYDLWKT